MASKKINNYLSKKLGLDIDYFAKNVPHMLFSNIILSVLGLLISIILARNLDIETFGNFNLIMSTIGIASVFSLPGLNNSMFKGLVKNFDGNFKKTFLLKRKYSFYSLLIFIPMAIYYLENFYLSLSFLFVGMVFPIYLSRQIWTQYLHSKSKFITANNYQIIQTTALFLIILFLTTLTTNLLFLIISYISIFLITDYAYFKKLEKKISNNNLSKDLYSYGKFLTKLNFINVLAQHLDSFFIGVFVGPAELTIYSVAKIFYIKSKDFIKSGIVTAGPKFIEHNTLKPKFYIIAIIGSTIFTVLILLLIKPLVVILFGDRYIESIGVAKVLFIALPFYTISLLLKYHLLYNTLDRKLQTIDSILPSAGKILLIAPMFYFFGFFGVAITVITQQILSILVIFYGIFVIKSS